MQSCFLPNLLEAGIDEAGRGCLAGPVCAAAVILPAGFHLPGLNDSKKLKPQQRLLLAQSIKEQCISYAVGWASAAEIDSINILQASFLAMHRAIEGLHVQPAHLLIDGNRFKPYPFTPHTCIVGGDGKYASIAAASILAKTSRDQLMVQMDEAYPAYLFARHKGYGTAAHLARLLAHGPSAVHRSSFSWPGKP